MSLISLIIGTASGHFDAMFATVIASCADFFGGARQGRDIEGCNPDPASRWNLARAEVAQAALNRRHL